MWASGVTLFVLVAGRMPFAGDSDGATLELVAEKEPTYPDDLSPKLKVGLDDGPTLLCVPEFGRNLP